MDLICIDITNYNCSVDDYVTLWGGNTSRLETIAKSFNNIPYTYITGLREDRVEMLRRLKSKRSYLHWASSERQWPK